MIHQIVKEINIALDNKCFISALSNALILPDICGKAQFPELAKQTRQRYIQWYDEYIGQYETDRLGKENNLPYLSGEVVYNLRCALLHQGDPHINEEKLDIQYFELVVQTKNRASHFCGSSGIRTDYMSDGTERKTRILSVSVLDLCYKLCTCAKHYYNNNKEKFDFFNYNVVNCDFNTSNIFKIKSKIEFD